MQTSSVSESDKATTGPGVVAEFQKNKRETVRVAFVEYQGHNLLEIRSYYTDANGAVKPGKGLAIQHAQVTTLRKALQAAERSLAGKPTKGERPAAAPDPEEDNEAEAA